ncbi:MAG: hypothetical protein JNK79_06195 [Chitinophagaceae bacterium]|nr:hypothetical protein [Chitinophagaceae bacterium]
MKKFWTCVVVVFVALFAGCYEINEEITINDNGTGTYVTKMDMSALLQMMQSMASEEEIQKSGLDRVIDTVISLKTVLDTAKDVTPEQKRLFEDGTMKMKVDLKQSIFTADVNFPFKNLTDLQALMSGSGTGGLSEVFKQVFAKNDSARQSGAAMDDQSLDQVNNVFDVTISNGKIERKLNRAKYDSVMAKPELEQARQMMGGGFEILYTTTIRLPRPVKKTDNEMIRLSDDKKTVTMRYDLMKMFETPEKFAYTIDY